MNAILIVGATGVVGEAALAHFAAAGSWQVMAISRRTPHPVSHGSFRHLAVDLTNPAACRDACKELRTLTHVVFTAVAEQPGLIAGWRDPQQMQLNLAMLRNLVEPLSEAAQLQHITLLQGAKAYGAHVGHQTPVPARERAPRVQHENFYWLQEDYIRAKAAARGFAWTIFRPQVVIGAATGAAMNPLLPLAAYAAIRQEEGSTFSYPGGELQISELVDAKLLAEAFEWAASAPNAKNETFNITNGDVFAWRDAWPAIAAALHVEPGPDEPMRLAEYLSRRATVWDTIVARHELRSQGLMRFLGESHHYLDILLRMGADRMHRPTLLSTTKLRQAGFTACRDSEHVIAHWLDVMRQRRLIPDLRGDRQLET